MTEIQNKKIIGDFFEYIDKLSEEGLNDLQLYIASEIMEKCDNNDIETGDYNPEISLPLIEKLAMPKKVSDTKINTEKNSNTPSVFESLIIDKLESLENAVAIRLDSLEKIINSGGVFNIGNVTEEYTDSTNNYSFGVKDSFSNYMN